jgi:CHASE2 domain-containing sensor protein
MIADHSAPKLLFLDRIINAIVEHIVAFTDYFVTPKQITLSEATIFASSMAWLVWFVFGGTFHHEDTPLTRLSWVLIFAATSVTHFTAFFFKRVLARAYVMCFHAFVWGFLCILALQSKSSPPAFPTLFVFTALSTAIAIRLFRESKQVTNG